jgi:hypothetical protein
MASLTVERPNTILDVFKPEIVSLINGFLVGNTSFVNNKYCEIMNETDPTECVRKIHDLSLLDQY